ncbi:MAG: hypothetical protein JW702_03705 [Clostridiales bacterium]|nr:hypothetical protein [Clostridiales bacterium]
MSKSTSNLLKIIAMVTMLIDHIGYLFFPNIILLRIIGRIAFPLFAYLLVTGYIYTKDINRYLFRLGIFAIISQIPYHFFVPGRYNVILFFFIALLSLKYHKKSPMLIIIATAFLTETLNISYGMYGIFTIYIFYYYYHHDYKKTLYSFTLLNIVFTLMSQNIVQFFSLLALPFLKINLKTEIHLNKYIAYLFYPVHISILLLIKYKGLL